ncbi:potassium transporter 5-like [Vigna radiata var. radiata]|uniref:Potassium transporter 5-like n=1 Tax=Vigna radiata var. radiata TaxID=3916 RepID=A0A1S3TYV5_VIGRR|nr:potassium transporter 5-like [Vigna radiata var. radiata]
MDDFVEGREAGVVCVSAGDLNSRCRLEKLDERIGVLQDSRARLDEGNEVANGGPEEKQWWLFWVALDLEEKEESVLRVKMTGAEGKLRHINSLSLEAGRVCMDAHKMGWRITLSLAFQSLGIVYGDIGTSPLYVYASTFTNGIKHNDDILGVLSLIIYTILLIPMIKYVFIVLWANDNGNGPLYWPTFVVAVAAAIIASQAMISGAFSIIAQALSLGCFPRVRVVHTSIKHHGQVYIPEINYMFMIACIVVCAAFKTTEKISHAYGIAVIGDMMITTTLVSLIMLVLWEKSLWRVTLFFFGFSFVELLYLTSQLTKFTGGGYFPIVSAMFLTSIMGIWHYVHKERYMFELKNKVSSAYLNEVANNPNVRRVPGIGLLYSELVQGIPPIFPHLIASIPSVHSILVFVSIKTIPVSSVASEERFLFRRVEPREYRVFRCVVRHGYNDLFLDLVKFESELIQNLKTFIQEENYHMVEVEGSGNAIEQAVVVESSDKSEAHCSLSRIITNQSASSSPDSIRSLRGSDTKLSANFLTSSMHGAEEELKFIEKALEKNVVYMLAEAEVVAHPNSTIINKIIVNYVYSFFRKNFRQGQSSMAIPCKRLLKIGMTYEI